MPFTCRTAALAMTFLIGAVAPAQADWGNTQWGMTPDQVLAALDGARPHDPTPAEIYKEAGKSYAPLVKLNGTIEGVAGQVSLLFGAGETLHFVLFNPETLTQCDALGAALTERYGAADATGAGSLSISDWVSEGNRITLTNYADAGICNLSYSSL